MKKLVLTLVLVLTAIVAQNAAAESWYFTGKMGNRVSAELFLMTDKAHEDIVAGYIYYPKSPKPAPILVVGSRNQNMFDLHEYLSDGTVSGNIHFFLNEDSSPAVIGGGDWTNPKTGAKFSLDPLKNSLSTLKNGKYPAWWPGNPLTPAQPQNIPGTYRFSIYSPFTESMLGGTAEFREAGEDRLHFDIENRWYHTAEGHSRNHCPAVLDGNEFEYDDVNECGYGFRAVFYKRFVVIQTTTAPETLTCFGSGATLAATYLR